MVVVVKANTGKTRMIHILTLHYSKVVIVVVFLHCVIN